MGASSLGSALRIAILAHEVDGRRNFGLFGIHQLAELWRADGHSVRFVYGASQYEPADVALLHVDLSQVPAEYTELADRYPLVLNRHILDIRKSRFSELLVSVDDSWQGPVIVKTDQNYGGEPERIREQSSVWHRLARRAQRWWGNQSPGVPNYQIYEHKRLVPEGLFADSDYVVERFLPERTADGQYRIRSYVFFGGQADNYVLTSPSPIVNSRTAHKVEQVPAPSEMDAIRRRHRIDFGKLDYVINEGQVRVFDINKTVGSVPLGLEVAGVAAARRRRANALYSLIEELRLPAPSDVGGSPDSSSSE